MNPVKKKKNFGSRKKGRKVGQMGIKKWRSRVILGGSFGSPAPEALADSQPQRPIFYPNCSNFSPLFRAHFRSALELALLLIKYLGKLYTIERVRLYRR